MTLFRPEALEHKRRKLHGEVIIVQPVSFFVLTAVFFVVTAVIVAFLASGEYKRKETVIGYIAPERGLSVIRADQGGRLTQVFVSEGDVVPAGTPLFAARLGMETEGGRVGERRLKSTDVRLSELREQEAGIKARFRGERARLNAQKSSFMAEISGLRKRRVLQTKSVEIAASQLKRYARLSADGTTSQLELDQAKSGDINQRLNLASVDQQIIARQAALAENKFAQKALVGNEERELSGLRIQISQLEQSRVELEASDWYIVRSPIGGTIAALQGTVGQSISPNAPVVMIIPEDTDMVATLLTSSKSVAFLEAGQDVNLLIDAFPYQKFGVQKGVIKDISKTPYKPGELDAPIPYEQSVYRVVVTLNKQTVTAYGKEVPIKTGMTLQGDLIVDSRTLLQWMMEPLLTMKRS
ncbi:MAG: HlyD family efflux transporter periplasmic adaptor subunit [Robiginitomaculum sp.]|nr:HlyD family efflux transporter periplasmic adaptor subunit [Robiginitomaculum sp.]